MVDATSARLLSIIRIEAGNMLVFEDVTGTFAGRAKAILGHCTVVAVRSQSGSQTVLSNPLRSVQYLGRDHTALIGSMVAPGSAGAHAFHRIICLGRPDLSDRLSLVESLKGWEKYLAPGGRVVVEMFRTDDYEHWRTTEAAYRQAIKATGFELEQINGVERDEVFLTGAVEVYAYALSIKHTARLIRPLDEGCAQKLIRTSKALQHELKESKHPRNAEEMLEDIIGCGYRHRLYATLRLG